MEPWSSRKSFPTWLVQVRRLQRNRKHRWWLLPLLLLDWRSAWVAELSGWPQEGLQAQSLDSCQHFSPLVCPYPFVLWSEAALACVLAQLWAALLALLEVEQQ